MCHDQKNYSWKSQSATKIFMDNTDLMVTMEEVMCRLEMSVCKG